MARAGATREAPLRFLAEASVALAGTLDYRATLATVARLAIPVLGDLCVVYLLTADGRLQRVAAAHADPAKEPLARRMQERVVSRPDAPSGPAHVLRTLRTAFYPRITEDMHRAVIADPEHLADVLALGIRASIVVPLLARARPLGVISFILTEPGREYGPDDVALAEALAQRVALAVDNALLHRELQQAVRRQAESHALLDTLFASTPVGLALLDRDGRYLRVNDALSRLTGVPAAAHLGRTVRDVLGDLATEIEPRIRHVLDTGETLTNVELTEAPRAWLASYFPLRAADGQVTGLGITTVEITEQKRAERERERLLTQLEAERARLETVLQQMPAGVLIADAPAGRLILANAQAERIWRLPFLPAASMHEWEAVGYRALHPDGRPYRPEESPLARAISRGETIAGEETQIVRGDGTTGSIRIDAAPIRGRNGEIEAGVVSFIDITEQRRVEEHTRYLAEIGELLASSLDWDATLQRVAQLAVPRLADWCLIDVVAEDGTPSRLAIAHADPDKVRWAREIERRYPFDPEAPPGLAQVLRTGEPAFYPEITEAMLAANSRDAEHLRIQREIGYRSGIVVPLQARGRILGAITLVMAESNRRYTERDLDFAKEVARRAALAVDNARLYAAERRARVAAERAATRIAQIQSLTAALGATLTPREIAVVTTSAELAALGIRSSIITALADDGATLEVLAAVGYPEGWGERWRRMPCDSRLPLADAARRGTPVFLPSRTAMAAHYPAVAADPDGAADAAFAALPLIVEGRSLGVLGLGFATPQAFDEEDRAFLLALARQCAHALERARLYQAAQDARSTAEAARRRQTFLAQASSILSSSLDYAQTLRSVAEMAVPDFADWCIVRILEADGTLRHLVIAHQDAERRERIHQAYRRRAPRYVRPHPIAEALEGNVPILRTDLTDVDWAAMASDAEHLELLRIVAPRSVIVVPLMARGHRLGLISFICADSLRRYDADDLTLAQELAHRAAVAVDNAVLFQTAQAAEESSRRQAERKAALAAASSAFAEASLDLPTVLATVTQRIAELVGDGCLIRLLVSGSEETMVLAPGALYHPDPEARALAPSLLESIEHSAIAALHREALGGGQPVLLHFRDQAEFRRVMSPEYHVYAERFRLHSLLTVPLHVRGSTIGTLVLWRDRTPQPFTPEDVTFVRDLAGPAALAIENARLYREAQSAVRAREDFLSTASHELRTPLTTVKGYGQLLLRFLRQPTADRQHLVKLATHLCEQINRFETLVNDLLDVSRIQQGRLELRPQPMDLSELAGAVLRRFEESPERTPAHRLTLDAPEPIEGHWDPGRLDQVLTNLISNALKFSPNGGEVRVTVRRRADMAEVAVRDEGIGIPLEEQGLLFQPFARSHRARREIGGTGLGLFIARQIAEQHGGTITLESADGAGSTFTLRLPLMPAPARATSGE